MADSPSTVDCSDTSSSSTRSSSGAPPTNDIRFSIATPVTIETDLEAARARYRRRKASDEVDGNAPHKKLKPTGAPVNRGGRPKKEKPSRPKQPNGDLRLRQSNPVKAYIPPELWKLVFEQSSPAMLLRWKHVNRNFYKSLTSGDQLSLWLTARKLTYGAEHPDPPAGINEIQYADLIEGQGCQGRGCRSSKTRKTYWVFLRRWCEKCLEAKIVKEEDAAFIMRPYTGYMGCVPQAMRDSWDHYQWIGDPSTPRPAWAKYQKHARTILLKAGPEGLDGLKARADAFNRPNADGSPKTTEELNIFFEEVRRDMTEKIEQRRKVENWEAEKRLAQKDENQKILHQRTEAIEKKAAKMTLPASRIDLEKLACFKNATKIPKPFTKRSWRELQPKLVDQLKELREKEACEALEQEKALVAKELAHQEALDRAVARITSADADQKDSEPGVFGRGNFPGKSSVIPHYRQGNSSIGATACVCPHNHSSNLASNINLYGNVPASSLAFVANLALPANPSQQPYLNTAAYPASPSTYDQLRQLRG